MGEFEVHARVTAFPFHENGVFRKARTISPQAELEYPLLNAFIRIGRRLILLKGLFSLHVPHLQKLGDP